MIKVNYVVSNNLIKSVSIKGHAFYDTYGKDIVCAAVSSIVTTTINDILALTEDKIKYDNDRMEELKKQGVKVIRFYNIDVDKNFYEVCSQIDREVNKYLSSQLK